MRKFVLVMFPDEASADRGVKELHELHRAGSVHVFAAAVVARSELGALVVRRRGEAIARRCGLEELVLPDELVDDVDHVIPAGKFAVIAEIWEEWVTPMDARMTALGGRLACEWCSALDEEPLAKRAPRDAAPELGWTAWPAWTAAGRGGWPRC